MSPLFGVGNSSEGSSVSPFRAVIAFRARPLTKLLQATPRDNHHPALRAARSTMRLEAMVRDLTLRDLAARERETHLRHTIQALSKRLDDFEGAMIDLRDEQDAVTSTVNDQWKSIGELKRRC